MEPPFLETLVPLGINCLTVQFENGPSMQVGVENTYDTFGDAAALAGLQLKQLPYPTMRDPEAIAQVLEFVSFDSQTRVLVVKKKQEEILNKDPWPYGLHHVKCEDGIIRYIGD
ncbi:MAG: hypothetical protein WC657_00770 [Candidatus Paceibacterota bacterium]|jgi:hypothetical protein